MIEFSIDKIGDTSSVIGRCLRGPVNVGDVFSSVYRLIDVSGSGPTRADVTSVKLRIEHIDAYRRSWTTLDEGMTAKITLSGDGLAALSPGHILGV